MREDLTVTVRQTLEQAQAEARALNQEFVGTEHLLLGIIRDEAAEATRALRTGQVRPEALRSALMNALPRGKVPSVVTGQLPLSPKAQRAINDAIVRAQALREARVSTRLVLLSLLDEPETVARQTLRACGADVEHLARLLAQRPEQAEK